MAAEATRIAHFLVADDDAATRTLVARILRKAFNGCRVVECESAEQALELVNSAPQDALITDFNMPRMSGALLALELRKKHNQTPIVILSQSEQSGMASMEAGADAFLTKDLLEDLPRIIHDLAPWIEQPEAPRE